jgi:hypothetical protein
MLTDREKTRAKTEGLFSVDVVVGGGVERLRLFGLEQQHVDACHTVCGLGVDYITSSVHSDAHNMNAAVCKFLGVKVKAGYPVAWQYVIFPNDVAHLTLG